MTHHDSMAQGSPLFQVASIASDLDSCSDGVSAVLRIHAPDLRCSCVMNLLTDS